MLKRLLLLAPALLLGSSLLAHADSMTFSLTVNGCSSSCGTGPFATITVTQTSATTVTVQETLASGDRYAGTGAGDALLFDLSGGPAVTITGLTSGFEAESADSASTFGSFEYSITCDYSGGACHGGKTSNYSGPLAFTITDPNGISLSDFIANSKGYYFASDIFSNGNTGNVGGYGGVLSVTPTPEPSSLLLMGSGILGSVGLVRRRFLA